VSRINWDGTGVHNEYRNRFRGDYGAVEKAVITIGNFDGVHIGHQALFHTVIEKARASRDLVAMTFDPHPCGCWRPTTAPR
jgi:FAD synthase